VILPPCGGKDYVAHLYVVRSPQRDALREYLRSHNIASEVHYPIPDYLQPVFGERYVDLSLPNTEKLAKEILTLPCYPEMTETDVGYVIERVNAWQS
jgi:dTDP-4-amino-4,6-dideoxygalactose transaminase